MVIWVCNILCERYPIIAQHIWEKVFNACKFLKHFKENQPVSDRTFDDRYGKFMTLVVGPPWI